MQLFSAILIFSFTWWFIFFMTLPFGVRRPENPEPGHAAGAPANPRLWLKAAITTVLAIGVTALIIYLLSERVIPLKGAISG